MQFILSTAVMLTLSLALFQCDKQSAANSSTQTQATTTTANAAPAPAAKPQQATTGHEGHNDAAAAQIPRITLADAKADFDAGKAVFVDSRSAGSFNIERIKGAINIPYGASSDEFKKVPQGKKVIVYCS